jgi:hypothetical protein
MLPPGSGDLEEAQEPGGSINLGPLDALAGSYQQAGRHEEALALAAALLREIPASAQKHDFRSFVRRSENALGRFESILPQPEHSLRGRFRAEGSPYPAWLRNLVIWGGAATVVVAGILLSNGYIRRHRVIQVVSACVGPVLVQVDSEPPIEFTGFGALSVAEGRHRIKMTGAVEATSDVEVRTGYLERWVSKPVWVLNPGGEAVLAESTVYYAEFPQRPQQRLLVGRPFLYFRNVDYPFAQPPDQLEVKKGQQLSKTALEWIQGQDADAFLNVCQTERAAAIAFAENRLKRFPDVDELLKAYLGQVRPEEISHVEEFLRSGLDRRPAVINWHRAYQGFAEMNGHDRELVPLYDGFLKAEPTSAVFRTSGACQRRRRNAGDGALPVGKARGVRAAVRPERCPLAGLFSRPLEAGAGKGPGSREGSGVREARREPVGRPFRGAWAVSRSPE